MKKKQQKLQDIHVNQIYSIQFYSSEKYFFLKSS